MDKRKPLIAVVPFGISRDCSAHTMRLLASEGALENAGLVLVADRDAAVRGQIATGQVAALQPVSTSEEAHQARGVAHLPVNAVKRRNTLTGEEQIDLGGTVLAALRHALQLAREGAVDGLLVLGDPCRPGDRLAAMPQGVLVWMAEAWRRQPDEPLPTLADIQTDASLWHLCVLEPMPLADVAASLTPAHLEQAVALLTQALAAAGFDNPNIAVASLNPRRLGGRYHGTEEVKLMGELAERCEQSGHRLFGPWPLDEILADVRDGALDAVITLHAEQARVLRGATGMARAPQIVAGLGVPCVRATWERQAGRPANTEAEFGEALQALNMVKLLASGGKPSFRFRGESRVSHAPKR